MKRRMGRVALVSVLFCLFGAAALFAQEQTQSQAITVSRSQVTDNVLILSVREGNKSFELHCNEGMSDCTALKPGSYSMVQLPKNWGMYDCSDVDLYAATAASHTGDKLGEYCLIKKNQADK